MYRRVHGPERENELMPLYVLVSTATGNLLDSSGTEWVFLAGTPPPSFATESKSKRREACHQRI